MLRVAFRSWTVPLALAAIAGVFAPAATAAPQDGRRAQRSWSDRAPTRWSKHYLIQTDLPEDSASAYAAHLDRIYEEFSRRLASLPPRAPEKLNVYIFEDRDEYLRTLRLRWGVNAEGTGGIFFVNPTGSGLAFWTESLPERRIHHVIQHEGFHQFAYSRFGGDLPQWVNEGLAEFFGESVLVNNDFILGQATPRVIDSLKNAIELKTFVPFHEMLRITDREWSGLVQSGRADICYEQSWSMVHFLVYGDGARYQPLFERYLRLLNDGVPSEPAFVRVFGADLDAFEKSWKEYALAAQPSAFVTALERIEFLAEGALALSRKKVVPESAEAFEQALAEIGFSYTINSHVHQVELTADDHANFLIPQDSLSAKPPVFVITKPKLREMTPYKRRIEEETPTPSAIGTENLRPRGLAIKWIRDRKTKEIRYEIVVKRRE